MVACVCCRVSVCVPVSLCLCMCAYVCVVCVLMFAGAHPITTDVITAVGERGNHADRKTDNRKDRRTDKQTERQINRQKDRQTRRGCESESERDQVSGREIRTHHSRRHSTPPAIRSRAFILYSLFWSQIQSHSECILTLQVSHCSNNQSFVQITIASPNS